jgi:hypothetical protein
LPDLSDTTVRKLTGEILARPEFAMATWKESYFANWLHRFFGWLAELQFLHDTSPVLYWTIFAGVGLVTVGLVAHMIWALWIALNVQEPSTRSATGRAAPNILNEARSLADGGRYLEGAHRLMIASFHLLADRSIIELRPDRSNRWIRTAILKSSLTGGLANELDRLVESTERRWFGRRDDDPEFYILWLSTFEQLSAELR